MFAAAANSDTDQKGAKETNPNVELTAFTGTLFLVASGRKRPYTSLCDTVKKYSIKY
jgi:hypothetical protein